MAYIIPKPRFRRPRHRHARRKIRNRRNPQKPRRKPQQKPKPLQEVSDKAALLIGIEYLTYARQRKANRLPGCHRDIATMSSILQNRYGVEKRNIVKLLDDGKHGIPNKANILKEMKALLHKGKKLFLVYSGHGSHQRDRSGDEKDGQDEMLVPSDYLHKGFIVDDNISNIFSRLKEDQSICAIFDCCHSGSLMDLPVTFEKRPSENTPIRKCCSKLNDNSNGKIICLSACTDQQTSVSAYNLSKRKNWQGAMTFAFSKLPYKESNGKVVLTDVSKHLEVRGFQQITSLSTNLSVDSSDQVSFPF